MFKQKLKIKLKKLIPLIIAVILIIPTTYISAETFTPKEREAIELYKGTPGLSYNSFNNFIDGKGVNAQKVEMPTEKGKTGDERNFMLLHECPDGDVCTNPVWYQNSDGDVLGEKFEDRRSYFDEWPNGASGTSKSLIDGDQTKFMVYFHNNADDPFDGGSEGHIAKDVEIGVSIPQSTYSTINKPFGFIDSDDATYRTNHKDPSTVIKDSSGNPIHKVTDDTVIESETPIDLRLKKNWVFMQLMDKKEGVEPEDQEALYFDWVAPCNFDAAEGSDDYYTNSVTVHPEGNTEAVTMNFCLKEMKDKIAIVKFDKIPGCFAYAGFLSFDAQVYEEPVCSSLGLNPLGDITEGDTVTYNVTPIDQFGNSIGGDVTWSNNTGAMWTEKSCTPGVDCDAGSPTLKTNGDSTVEYSGGADGQIVITHEKDPTGKCTEVIEVFKAFEEPEVCTEFSGISLPASPIEVGGSALLKVQGSTNKGPFNAGDLITWKTSSGTLTTIGLFPEKSGTELNDVPATITVLFEATKAGTNVVFVEYQGNDPEGLCKEDFFSVKDINVCKDLSLIANDEDGIIIDEIPLGSEETVLKISPSFSAGAIPPGTLYEWESFAGGGFSEVPGAVKTNPLVTASETVYFSGATDAEGAIKVKVATDEFTIDQCAESIFVEKAPPPVPVCKDLIIEADSNDGAPFYTGEKINIKATAFDQFGNKLFTDINYKNTAGGEFTSLYYATGGPQPEVTVIDKSTTPNNETEVIFDNATHAGEITVSVDGTLNVHCIKKIPILEAACVELTLDPAGPFVEGHAPSTLTVTGIDELGNPIEGPFLWESFSGSTFTEVPCSDPAGCAPAEKLVTLGHHVIFDKGTAASPAIKVSKLGVKSSFLYSPVEKTPKIDSAFGIDIDPKEKVGTLKTIPPVFAPLSFGNDFKFYKNFNNDGEKEIAESVSKVSKKDLSKLGIKIVADGVGIEKSPTSKLSDAPDPDAVYAAETVEEEEKKPLIIIDTEDLIKDPKILGPLLELDKELILPGTSKGKKLEKPKTETEDFFIEKADVVDDVCAAYADIIKFDENCTSIKMIVDPAPFDPTKETKITLLSELGDYKGGFFMTAYSEDGETLSPGVFDLGEAAKASNPITITDTSVTITFTGGEPGDNIEVIAISPKQANKCQDRIHHTPIVEELACQYFDLDTDPEPFDPTASETELLLTGEFGDYTGKVKYNAFTPSGEAGAADDVLSKGVFYTEGTDPADGKNPLEVESPTVKVFFTNGAEGDYIEVYATEPEGESCRAIVTSSIAGICEEITLEPGNIKEIVDNKCKFTAKLKGNYDGDVKIEASGETVCSIDTDITTEEGRTIEATCESCNLNSTINVFAPDFEDQCKVVVTPDPPSGEGEGEGEGGGGGGGGGVDRPPEVIKRVRSLADPDSKFSSVINATDGTQVEYQILIEQDTNLGEIHLWDTIGFDGLIGGSIDGHIKFEAGSLLIEQVLEKSGKILKIVEICEDEDGKKDKKLCVEPGVPFELATKETPFIIRNLKNKAHSTILTYRGTVTSKIDGDYCRSKSAELNGCGEDFVNNLRWNFKYLGQSFLKKNKDHGGVNARVVVVCPYILSKTAGDIFFEDQFNDGVTVDIGKCAPIKSTEGVIITPVLIEEGQEITQTGACKDLEGDALSKCLVETAEQLAFPTHAACSLSNEEVEGNISGLQNPIKSLSSSVCETKARVSDLWRWEFIKESIEENKFKFAKWNNNITDAQITNFASQLKNANNAQSGVFKRSGDLTLGSGNVPVKFGSVAGNSSIHIIVEGDLNINSNIEYDDNAINLASSSPKDFPSLAFTVFGDINIAPEVEQMDGIYIAIQDEETKEGGRIQATDDSELQLVIVGSLIGDMQELIKSRTYTADYSTGGGNVVIHYSERVHLNTPPGLSDWLDISIFKQKFGLDEL